MTVHELLINALKGKKDFLAEDPWYSGGSSFMKQDIADPRASGGANALAQIVQALAGGAMQGYGEVSATKAADQYNTQLLNAYNTNDPAEALSQSPDTAELGNKMRLAQALEADDIERQMKLQELKDKTKPPPRPYTLTEGDTINNYAYNPQTNKYEKTSSAPRTAPKEKGMPITDDNRAGYLAQVEALRSQVGDVVTDSTLKAIKAAKTDLQLKRVAEGFSKNIVYSGNERLSPDTEKSVTGIYANMEFMNRVKNAAAQLEAKYGGEDIPASELQQNIMALLPNEDKGNYELLAAGKLTVASGIQRQLNAQELAAFNYLASKNQIAQGKLVPLLTGLQKASILKTLESIKLSTTPKSYKKARETAERLYKAIDPEIARDLAPSFSEILPELKQKSTDIAAQIEANNKRIQALQQTVNSMRGTQ